MTLGAQRELQPRQFLLEMAHFALDHVAKKWRSRDEQVVRLQPTVVPEFLWHVEADWGLFHCLLTRFGEGTVGTAFFLYDI